MALESAADIIPFHADDYSDENDILPSPRILDPVHGYIGITSYMKEFIDTPQFQRLRYLKQLGTAYFVFPGATHNRFEHSIGVAHLAKQLVEHLRHHQPSLQITDRDVKCVTVAGLLHDLGHGPFSHLWDTAFIPTARPDIKWVHEDASLMMFDFLVKDNNIDIAQDDINFIKDLIKGEVKYSRGRQEKPFLFEIVANQRNGIDVDKFDYIARDSKAVGIGENPNPMRLIGSARVVDNQICYNYKDTTTVLEMFGSRFALHRKIYNHRVAKAIDLMFIDALLAADDYLDIASRIDNPERYQYLTDDIILEIERSTAPELAKSRDIIRRVRKRQFYAEVDQVYIPWAAGKRWEKELTAEKIFQQYQALDATCDKQGDDAHEDEALKVEDILIHHGPLHWGRGSNNPINNVKFYSKRNPHEALLAQTELVTHVLPKRFGEIQVRIYTKNLGTHFGLIQEAYRKVSRTLIESAPSSDDAESSLPLTISPTPPLSVSHSVLSTATTTPVAALTTPKRQTRPLADSRDSSAETLDGSLPAPSRRSSKEMSVDDEVDHHVSADNVLGMVGSSPVIENAFTKVPRGFDPRTPGNTKRSRGGLFEGIDREKGGEGLDVTPVKKRRIG